MDFVVERAISHESYASYESDYAYEEYEEGEGEGEDGENEPLEVDDASTSYKVSNISNMGKLVDSKGKEIATLLNISFDAAIALLIKCKWCKENALNEYCMNEEANSCADSSSSGKSSSKSGETRTYSSCPICCDGFPVNEMLYLSCGHGSCLTCWDGHLTSKVSDGPSCVIATCPMYKCNEIVPYSFFQQHVDPLVMRKYMEYVTKNFIENHRDIKYCPAADCDKVVIRQNDSILTAITCECSQVFCFQCGEEAHDPVNCAQLQEWNMKNKSESLTATWMVANTKNCPKCKIRIEKNLGCMHMTCQQCHHEFCWTCLAAWKTHNGCNRLMIDVEGNSKKEESKRELERYIHYYERYMNHDRALKIAVDYLRSVNADVSRFRKENSDELMRSINLQKAAEVIVECRRVLKHTYISGYYMVDGAKYKTLFEYQQEMLEKHTESLHGYMEQKDQYFEEAKIMNFKATAKHFLDMIIEWFQTLLTGTEEVATSTSPPPPPPPPTTTTTES
jgi:ariadne-1